MKHIVFFLAALALTACSSTPEAIDCGEGGVYHYDGDYAYCSYVVVRGGFRCPESLTNLIMRGEEAVCTDRGDADEMMLPPEVCARVSWCESMGDGGIPDAGMDADVDADTSEPDCSAVEAGDTCPSHHEGEFCGEVPRCGGGLVLNCSGGTWQESEVGRAPCFECGSEENGTDCRVDLREFCIQTANDALPGPEFEYSCGTLPEDCSECGCLSAEFPESTDCTESGGNLTLSFPGG